MIIIPASDIIQTNYHTYDGALPTSYNGDGDFSNIQLIGYNANNSNDSRGVNLAPVDHAYPYNLIANTISEDDQEEIPAPSKNTTKGVLSPDFDYRDKSSALIIVIVYDINNDQYINLSGITSLDIHKAKQAAIPVYCYIIYYNKSTCSSIYKIGADNSETIAIFYYYNDNILTIDESGAVTVNSNYGGGVN